MDKPLRRNAKVLLERCESGRIGLTANASCLICSISIRPIHALPSVALSSVADSVPLDPFAFMDRIMDKSFASRNFEAGRLCQGAKLLR
jgi:hypothetical protein